MSWTSSVASDGDQQPRPRGAATRLSSARGRDGRRAGADCPTSTEQRRRRTGMFLDCRDPGRGYRVCTRSSARVLLRRPVDRPREDLAHGRRRPFLVHGAFARAAVLQARLRVDERPGRESRRQLPCPQSVDGYRASWQAKRQRPWSSGLPFPTVARLPRAPACLARLLVHQPPIWPPQWRGARYEAHPAPDTGYGRRTTCDAPGAEGSQGSRLRPGVLLYLAAQQAVRDVG